MTTPKPKKLDEILTKVWEYDYHQNSLSVEEGRKAILELVKAQVPEAKIPYDAGNNGDEGFKEGFNDLRKYLKRLMKP